MADLAPRLERLCPATLPGCRSAAAPHGLYFSSLRIPSAALPAMTQLAVPPHAPGNRQTRSGGTLFAEIRVAYDGAISIVCDGSRMPLPGNIDVSRRRGGQGIQIHNPSQPAQVLRFVLTRRHACISLPVSERGLEMPDSRRPLFGVSIAVEAREVARRENLFGIVFAEIRHRVGISEREAKFFVLSFGGPDFFHQPVRGCRVLL